MPCATTAGGHGAVLGVSAYGCDERPASTGGALAQAGTGMQIEFPRSDSFVCVCVAVNQV